MHLRKEKIVSNLETKARSFHSKIQIQQNNEHLLSSFPRMEILRSSAQRSDTNQHPFLTDHSESGLQLAGNATASFGRDNSPARGQTIRKLKLYLSGLGYEARSERHDHLLLSWSPSSTERRLWLGFQSDSTARRFLSGDQRKSEMG